MIQHRSSYGKPFRLVNAQGPEVNVIQRDTVMLLIGKPGHLRNALQSLVSVAPGLDGLITADTGPMALKVMREVRPSVVLIGSGLPDMEVLELLRQTKGGWPETSCLVLTDGTQQHREALAAGADCVLPAGMSAGQLFPIIQLMLEDSPSPK